jgi:mannose-6-phosphate isomerase
VKKPELYPLKFNAIYKGYIWGGRNLEKFGKIIGQEEIVAESWEIADHDEDVSIVKNGHFEGKSLRELIELYGEDICPKTDNGRFPIIMKYLDANKRLSVQVHPDDEYARSHESPLELGKNECWFILDAPPGAELILGIKKGLTKEGFKKLIEENRLEEGLNRLPISRGDFIFIRSGTVHALLEGAVVCEILQNSDTTYRLYDWGRVGQDSKPRPLHIDKALDVINFPRIIDYEKHMKGLVIDYDKENINRAVNLIRCKYFNIDYLHYVRELDLAVEEHHFHILNILSGGGEIIYNAGKIPIRQGETVLVPQPVQRYTIKTQEIEMIKVFL